MSDAIKRLRFRLSQYGRVDEADVGVLLDIAEAALTLANGAITYPNIVDAEVQMVHLLALNNALAKLEAPGHE